MTHRVLTAENDGDDVHLSLGESVTIRLPEIGGTAFLWHAQPDSGCEIVDSWNDAGYGPPGAASTRTMIVAPLQPGELLLTLDRHRPWETSDDADSSVSFRLLVTQSAKA